MRRPETRAKTAYVTMAAPNVGFMPLLFSQSPRNIEWRRTCNREGMKLRYLHTIMLAGAFVAGTLSAQSVDATRERQQERIADGVRSGELTPHETRKIERKEKKINREIREDRRENGGHLTPSDKAEIKRKQQRVSKDIYKEKHDRQER